MTQQSSFVKGTIIITIATLISKILGSIFQIPLQNIAGDKVLGIFGLVYPVYMIALILSVAGIPIAISKLISEAKAAGRDDEIANIYRSASILAIAFGITSFILMFGFSSPIAQALGGEFTRPAVIVVSFTLLIAPYMAVYRGFFQGFEDMRPTAISQVLEQFLRVGLIIVAAYILVKQGAENEVVAGGVMIGSSVGALLSLFYLRMKFRRFHARPTGMNKLSMNIFRQWAKRILVLSIPIAIGSLTMALLNMIDSLTVPHGLKWIGILPDDVQEQFGIYRRGLSLVQIAAVFSSAVILPLIPIISKTMAKNDIQQTNHYIVRSLKMAHLVSWPAALGLVALTWPINRALFMDFQGSEVLALISFSSVFTSLTVLTTGILQGLNRSKLAAWLIVGGAILKGLLNIVLVSQFAIIGAAYATIITYILLTIVNIVMIYRTTNYNIWRKETLVFVGASIIMGVVAFLPLHYLSVMTWSRLEAMLYLVVMIPIGALVYAALVLLGKGFSNEELRGLPIIGRYFGKLHQRN
ncbi:putative polysaccharide biosynthesis protein [Bacillus sp. Marseille-P3661]|uniref:putative polysaccharide biosynthesis protein n=1 Tax=Bacillus sp. Marseille-P3661 TaxID=1936234 RepID=UPI000C84D296|nr:polysaccharide biosynthesis protein [Bacillus sp. Marseille-P3661]